MYTIIIGDPFSFERKEHTIGKMSLLDGILSSYGHSIDKSDIVISHEDENGLMTDVNPEFAKYITPKKGKFYVFIRPKDSDTARIALTVALVASGQWYASTFALGAFGAAAASAAISIGSAYLASAIIPYSDSSSTTSDKTESSTLSISGASNSINEGYPVPYLIGTHKFAPPKAMQPITESQGQDSYLTEVFCLGFGPLIIDRDNILIDETQIDEYDDFEIQIKDNYTYSDPIDLVSGDVSSETVSATFTDSGDEATRTTETDTEEITVEIAFPALVRYDDEGNRKSTSVSYTCYYKDVDDSVWIPFTGTSLDYQDLTFYTTSTKETLLKTKTYGAGGDNEKTYTYKSYGYGIKSYIQFNNGLPEEISVGKKITIQDTKYNSRTFTIQSISGSVVRVGSYEIDTYDITYGTQEYINQTGNQVQAETAEDAYIASSVGTAINYTATDATSTTTYRTHTITVNKGQYDVKIVRNTSEPDDTQTSNEFQWTQLKSTQYTDDNGDPIKTFPDELCYIALKIKATDQLNGSISNLYVTATSVAYKYDSDEGGFTEENGSGNPAWEYLNILLSPYAKKQLTEDEVEIEDFIEWAELCDEEVVGQSGETAPRFAVNLYLDYESTTQELLSKIASIGRAARRKVDYKESVLLDTAGKVPAIHLSPANIVSFEWSKSFVKRPDGYVLSFADEDDDYEVTELLVQRDDSEDASDLDYTEDLDATGITNSDQVYRYGKFAIAQIIQRPETYEITLGINSLQFLRGDVIKITHDRIQGVTCFGTVLAVSGKVVTVDNPFNITNDDLPLYSTFSDPTSYEQSIAVYEVTNIDGNELTFSSLPSFDMVDGQYAISDTVDSITRLYLVKNIVTADDLTATITAVDYAEDTIYLSEDDVSDYVSGTVDLSIKTAKGPSAPVITSVVTDESVLKINADGSLEVRAKVNLETPSNNGLPAASHAQIFYKLSDSNSEYKKIQYSVGEDYLITDLQETEVYDIKVRYISEYGVASTYAYTYGVEIIGKTSLPDGVSSINYNNGYVTWEYPNPALDFKGFKVRQASGTTFLWSEAIDLHDGIYYDTRYDVSKFVNGINTFYVKAVDTSGNYSSTAAKVITNLGDVDLENIVVSDNKFDSGWPDTKTDCYVNDDGYLESTTGEFYGDEGSAFYNQDSSFVFYSILHNKAYYEFSYTPDSVDVGSRLYIEYSATIDGTKIEWIQPVGDGEGGGDTYAPFSGVIDSIIESEYKFRATIPSNKLADSYIEYVIITVDVEDVEQKANDITISGGSMRLPLTKSFREIVNVQITLQSDSGTAVYAKVVDKDETLGPLIESYDSSGSVTESVADILIRGY